MVMVAGGGGCKSLGPEPIVINGFKKVISPFFNGQKSMGFTGVISLLEVESYCWWQPEIW